MVFVYGIQFTLIRHSSKKYQLKGKELVNLNNVEIDIKIVPIPISVGDPVSRYSVRIAYIKYFSTV